MKSFKKELVTVVILMILAVVGIYVVNAESLPPGHQSVVLLSNDTQAGHYPCRKPSTSRQMCTSSGINCKAWEIYDACVDGSSYCD